MNRRIVVCLLTTALLAMAQSVAAQQAKKVPRIATLSTGSPVSSRVEAFRQGLRELGYVEGKNIVIEWRYGEGRLDRLPELTAELVRLNVDVIVATGDTSVRAAKKATAAIPIVTTIVSDPVALGFVASLARPGGNITGLTSLALELVGSGWSSSRRQFPDFPAWLSSGIETAQDTAHR
jgi:putative ABC transport system substrate-binding protein